MLNIDILSMQAREMIEISQGMGSSGESIKSNFVKYHMSLSIWRMPVFLFGLLNNGWVSRKNRIQL